MRVVAGSAKGHRLVVPKGRDVRPTSDRVKEALFSSLQPLLPGARVLDLFAGSGALAIEALSRGAAAAVLVERSRPALSAIARNLDATGLVERATVVAADLPGALDRVDGLFDLVLLDPPYRLPDEVLAEILERLVRLLADEGQVRLEWSVTGPAPRWPDAIRPGRVRRYGDTAIHEGTVGDKDST